MKKLNDYFWFLPIPNVASDGAYVMDIREATNIITKNSTNVNPHVVDLG